jgi:hypothetical protein
MQRPMPHLPLIAVTLTACFLPTGCSGHSWGGGTEANGGFKEGVTFDYSIASLTCDGRVFLILAANGYSGGSMISSPSAHGVLRATDGRQIAWSCPTRDGTSGTLTIAGQEFDLAKGAVFLVSLKANQTKVEQVAADMSQLQGGKVEEKLNMVGEAEPRIKAFLKACRGEM